ncbi:hypothetical protein CBR_g40213 [Chara braunii]|uniref:FCP1 homology domain-containing protein n=1 Tax=Chara braunii TaxID=69332 RepID=A0A388LTJ1_CHABU|nr:hypothetical protein CBR_g40213 [Chara braunii]|eukprot:GBG85575.1 hypothetical protein CBR_g40213 [Chara braunii]
MVGIKRLDQSHCTDTRLRHPENRQKPVFLKDLSRIWMTPELWHAGFGQLNTLLIDDSPYKSLVNPPYTSIFPATYVGTDLTDRSLGDGGSIRRYLESISQVRVVPDFVKRNPFGTPQDSMGAEAWALFVDFRKKYNFGCLWIGANGGVGNFVGNPQLSQGEKGGRYMGVKSAVIVPDAEAAGMGQDGTELSRDGMNEQCASQNNDEKEEGELVPEEEDEEGHKGREVSSETKNEKGEESEKPAESLTRDSMLLNGPEKDGTETDQESDRHGGRQREAVGSPCQVRKNSTEEEVMARRALSDDEESGLDEGEEPRRGSGDVSECDSEHKDGSQCVTSGQDRSDLLLRERVSPAAVRSGDRIAEQPTEEDEQARQRNTAVAGYVTESERDPNGSVLAEREEKAVDGAIVDNRQEVERHEEGANEAEMPVEEPKVKMRIKSVIVGVCEPEPTVEQTDNARLGGSGSWRKRRNSGKRKYKKRALAGNSGGAVGVNMNNINSSKMNNMFALDSQVDLGVRNSNASSLLLIGKKKHRGQAQWLPVSKLPMEQRLGSLNGRVSFIGKMDGPQQNIMYGGDGILGGQPQKDKPGRKKRKAKVGRKKGKNAQQQQQQQQQMTMIQELPAANVNSSVRPVAQDWAQGAYAGRGGGSWRPNDRMHVEEDYNAMRRRDDRFEGNVGHGRRWNGSASPVRRSADSPRKWRKRTPPRYDNSAMGTARKAGVPFRRSMSPPRRPADKHEEFRHGRERGRRDARNVSRSRSRSRERVPAREVIDRGSEAMPSSRAGNRRVDERMPGGGGKDSPRRGDAPGAAGVSSSRLWTGRDVGARSGQVNYRVGMYSKQYTHGSVRQGSQSYEETSRTQEVASYFHGDRGSNDNSAFGRGAHSSEWSQVHAPGRKWEREGRHESSAPGMLSRKNWR